ncbi:MAG: hypothetical protein J5886_04430 [Bacteroidales bacterium]|nr:hypothetical protein [Bacteroidales bacterium]
MRRIYHIIVSALAVFAFLPSCQEKLEEPINENEPFKISVPAILGARDEVTGESSDAGTRALIEKPGTESGRWILATWKQGDVVYVYKYSPSATTAAAMFKKVGVLHATKDGVEFQDHFTDTNGRHAGNIFYETNLEGEIDSDLEVGSNEGLLFSYKHEFDFSYSGQIGTLEDIDANFDYALYFTPVRIDHNTHTIHLLAMDSYIEKNSKLNFVSQQSIVRFEFYEKVDGQEVPLIPSELKLHANGYDDTVYTGDWVDYHYDYHYRGLMSSWGVEDMFFARPFSFYGYSPNVDEIVVRPSSGTNVVYVALRGNMIHNANRIQLPPFSSGNLGESTITLTATVGNDTYTYEKESWSFATNSFHDVKVTMKKVE